MAIALGTVAVLYALRREQEERKSDPDALAENIQSRLEELERRLQDAASP